MKEEHQISQELLETVERYINDEMGLSEKESFEQSMNDDKEFEQQVMDIKSLITGVENASLKNKLDEFHEQMSKSNDAVPVRKLHQRTRSNRLLYYSIAACIVVLMGIFWFMEPSSKNEKIFAAYFIPDPGLPTTMSNGQSFDFYDGMVNYKREEYDLALQKWKKILPSKNDNDTLNYFIGVTHLAKGNAEDAIPYLEMVQKQSESMFIEDSYFYLGLSHLKNNNLEDAIENFKKSDHPDAEKVTAQLEK